jgi:O-acetyl-ADP-ribose deacetylase (regulator of RNase III)
MEVAAAAESGRKEPKATPRSVAAADLDAVVYYSEEEISKSRLKQGQAIEIVTGDLFKAPRAAALAHCVSADFRMGKGIAEQFVKRFGGVVELKQQKVGVGRCGILQNAKDDVEDRIPRPFIYYLVTKSAHDHEPTYGHIADSLHAMKTHAIENQVSHICMPLIGCGIDNRDWSIVELLLEKVFHGSEIRITVFVW